MMPARPPSLLPFMVVCPEGAHRPFWSPFRHLKGPECGQQQQSRRFSSSTQCKLSFLSKERATVWTEACWVQ
eukprot:1150442-Pelagomonas_calceolata.AAC.7